MGMSIEKLREPKVFDMAIFDWAATAVGAGIIAAGTHRFFNSVSFLVYFIIIFIILVVIGQCIHKILGIDTMFGYYLGICNKPLRGTPHK